MKKKNNGTVFRETFGPGIQMSESNSKRKVQETKEMIEKKIKFVTPEQIISFCNASQNMKSDVDIVDLSNRYVRIDGKSIIGLMTVKLGTSMKLVVSGEDEDQVEEKLSSYLTE